jgi:MFS family permease
MVLAVLVARIREPARISCVVSPWSALKTAASLLYANRSAYVPVTISTACVIVLSQTQAAWVPLFYARVFHLEPGEAAMIVGLIFLVTAPAGQWLGGLLVDHLRARGIAAAPHFVQAACAMACIPAAAIFCTSTHIGASEAAYTVFNLLVFAATPSGLTAWQLLTPQRSRGLIIAFLVAFVTLVGVGAGPVVVGALTDRLFVDEAGLGAALLLVIVVAGVAGCLAALYGRRAFNRSVAGARHAADLV